MKETAYFLGLTGGIITLIIGVAALIIGSKAVMLEQLGKLGIYYSIWVLGIGIFLLIGAWFVPKEKRTNIGALLLIIFGILGIITMSGWIIGPALGLIAGILALRK